ncbi:unnamed protein product [Musa banksii]
MGHYWAVSCWCGDRTRESFLDRPCRGLSDGRKKKRVGRGEIDGSQGFSQQERGKVSEGPEERRWPSASMSGAPRRCRRPWRSPTTASSLLILIGVNSEPKPQLYQFLGPVIMTLNFPG